MIDLSLMDAVMNLLVYEAQNAQLPQPTLPRLAKPLKTRDSFILVSPTNESNFQAICKCTGHPEWHDDPRFNTFVERYRNWDAFQRAIEEWTSQFDAQECERQLGEAGVPCSRYLTIEEALADPQYEERASYSLVEDGGGQYKVPNLPFMFYGVKPAAGAKVPGIGEHSQDILREMLGYDEEQLSRCVAAGAIPG